MKRAPVGPERLQLIREYKQILQDVVDRRPSGIRLKIAEALGRNKSFVSQITNTNYDIPVPERHLELIIEIAHFTPEEKVRFISCYRRAHPRDGRRMAGKSAGAGNRRVLRLELPRLSSPAEEARVDHLIQEFAAQVNELIKAAGVQAADIRSRKKEPPA
jgi:hypothetical protein